MKTIIYRVSVLALISAAFSFAGCKSLPALKPVRAPVPAETPAHAKTPRPGNRSVRPLFVIERSKNANVVHYEASLAADGAMDPGEPVVAYWVLLAEDGRRKKLNWLEKKKAYGVKTRPAPSLDGYTLTLAAAPWLPLAVRKVGDAVRAEVDINSRPAVLEKMFIQAKEKLLGPKVEYIVLFGNDIATGAACSEKILPK